MAPLATDEIKDQPPDRRTPLARLSPKPPPSFGLHFLLANRWQLGILLSHYETFFAKFSYFSSQIHCRRFRCHCRANVYSRQRPRK